MKHKFIIPALILCLAVSVFSIVGCGGGGGSLSKQEESPKPEETHGSALSSFFERLKAEGKYDQFMAACDQLIVARSLGEIGYDPANDPDQVVTAPLTDAEEFMAEHVKPRYDSGKIIYILTPSEADLDLLLKGIGETSPYSAPDAEETACALFAITKRIASNGTSHVFSYKLPMHTDFTSEVTEYTVGSKDMPVENGEASGEMTLEELADFLADSFARFGEWALNYIDDYVETAGLQAAEFSSQVRSALDAQDLADLASAQHPHIDISYQKKYSPFSHGDYDHTVHRISTAQYHIYSCHSFSSGSDFYLVKCDYSSKPDVKHDWQLRNYSDGDPAYYTDYFAGPTDYIWVNTYINEYETDGEVVLVKTVPFETLQRNTTYSKGMDWSTGGQISIGGSKDGPTFGFQLEESVSHNKAVFYTLTDWTLTNRRDGEGSTHATFGVDVKGPSVVEYSVGDQKGHTHGGGTHDFDIWDEVSFPSAATDELHFTVEWVWEVKKQLWQNRDHIPFIGAATFTDRFYHGAGACDVQPRLPAIMTARQRAKR